MNLMSFFFCSILLAVTAMKEAVVKYDTVTFYNLIHRKNHCILFYVRWVSELKTLSPVWEELAQKFHSAPGSDVTMAKVDCATETTLCSLQDVSEYPTIKFYETGGREFGLRYRGVRDLESLEQFINSQSYEPSEFIFGSRIGSLPERKRGLFPLQYENFFDVVQNGNAIINFCTPWSSQCMELEPIWTQIAEEFRYEENLIVGVFDCTMSKTTCNKNEVRGYPSIVWLVDGVVSDKYSSKVRTFESLRNYILNKLGKKVPERFTYHDEEYDPGSSVRKLKQENFHEVISSGNATFVLFSTAWCSQCVNLIENWNALGGYFHSPDTPVNVTIVKVDCAVQTTLCEDLQVKELPTINAYRNGELEHVYAGGKNLDDLIEFVTLAAKSKKSVEEL